MNNVQSTSLLTLDILPGVHLSIALNVDEGTLVQVHDEVASCASLDEGSDSPPAGLAVILWSTAGSERVLDDLVAGAGGRELWGGRKMADELDLGEWASCGGGESASCDWSARGAEDLARKHSDGIESWESCVVLVIEGMFSFD